MTRGAAGRHRTAPPPGWRPVLAAGVVDSLCLSVAWTVVVLRVQATHGLTGTGLLTAAMLVGVALSAPAAGALARHLGGRALLRSTAAVEACLRVLLVVVVVAGAPLVVLVPVVALVNVVAWTGYAAMRAEVSTRAPGATALTWYATGVAAVEAVGVAVAAWLPVSTGGWDRVLVVVTVGYALALLPTALVARGSTVRPTRSVPGAPRVLGGRPSAPVVAGCLLMLLASGPALLAVGLAQLLHGPRGVVVAAVAFTAGSLLAPALTRHLDERPSWSWWALLAAGAVAGWVLAPTGLLALAVAQLLSGAALTGLEGLLDADAVRRSPAAPTAALARASAARALGSAVATASAPALVGAVGVATSSAGASTVLVLVAGLAAVVGRRVASSRRTGFATAV